MEVERRSRRPLTHGSPWKRWLAQCAVAFLAQAAFAFFPRWAWFLSVFGAVAMAGLIIKGAARRWSQIYLEDVMWTLVTFLAIGLLALAFDNVLWTYTQKHAGPALPASVLAMIDLDWKTENIGSRR